MENIYRCCRQNSNSNRKPDIMYINAHVLTSHFNGANDRINRKNGTNRANTENKRTEKTQKVKLLSALNF